MGKLTRTIAATKQGIIDELNRERDESLQMVTLKSSTRRERDKQRGRADGLWFAIRLLEDWDESLTLHTEPVKPVNREAGGP